MRRIHGNIGRDVTILDESKTSPILSHRVPIFPCILRKQEIQYYYYYLDHLYEILNSLSEKKKPLNMTLGISFQRFWSKCLENLNHAFTTAFRSPWGNRIRVVTMQACAFQLLCAERGRGFGLCDHDCKQDSWCNNVQRFFTIKCACAFNAYAGSLTYLPSNIFQYYPPSKKYP